MAGEIVIHYKDSRVEKTQIQRDRGNSTPSFAIPTFWTKARLPLLERSRFGSGMVAMPQRVNALCYAATFFVPFSAAQTDAVAIGRQHRQRYTAFKSTVTITTHPIQPPLFQFVDAGLDCRMLLAQSLKRFRLFACTSGHAQLDLAQQCTGVQKFIQLLLIGTAVKASIETALAKIGKSLLHFRHDLNRIIDILALRLNRVMHNELMLIFHHGHRYPQFHRTAGFAFGDPAAQRSKTPSRPAQSVRLSTTGAPPAQATPGMFEKFLKAHTRSCNRYRDNILPLFC